MTFLFVAIKDKPDDARGYMRDAGMTFPGVLNPDAGIFNSFQEAGHLPYGGTPTSIFLGADGSIVSYSIGPLSGDQFDQKIDQLIGAG